MNPPLLRAAVLFLIFLAPFLSPAADIVWTNLSGGNWNVAANWSPNQVPVASDNAFITNNGTYTVTLNAAATNASFTLGGASGTQSFTNAGQTFTLNGASVINGNGRFVLGGGALTGAGDLTANGTLIWSGGAMSGSGTTFANGGLILSGTTKVLNGRTLINNASATWSAGQINMGGVISNSASGTFDCAFDGTMANNGGGTVVNAGLFRKTAGTGTTILSSVVALNNSGTVEIQTGTLSLNGGGTSTGGFTVLAGATLDLGGGTHNLNAGSTISGAGNFLVSGATANLAGTLGVGGTNTISVGTANFTGSYTISGGTLNISGGTANFNGNGVITPAALNLSGGTLGGTNIVTVSGPLNWTGGVIGGTNNVIANGGLILSGTTKVLTDRMLINNAGATWSAGNINMGGVISNSLSGTFDCAFDGTMANNGGGTVANAGLFRKTAGTGTTILSSVVALNNSGTVEIQTGTLSLGGGGTCTGGFTVLAGATLDLGGGTHNLNASSTVSGAGNFLVSGATANLAGTLGVGGTNTISVGTANFTGSYTISSTLNISGGTANFNGNGVITPAALNLSGGTLGGTNIVTVSGPLNWTGGAISGTNNVIANGGLTLAGTTKVLTDRMLINNAGATWSAGQINMGGVISNSASGTFDCAFDGSMANNGGGSVANAGLFRKTGGTGATILNNVVALNNFGTVEIQTGTLSLNGGGTSTGGFTVLAGATLDLGGGTHNLNAGSTISGAGNFLVSGATANLAGTLGVGGTNTISVGTANFTGSYTISGGTLNISGGTANFNGNGVITPAVLNLSGGTLGGSNHVTVSSPMNWTGGTINGTNNVIANGGLILSGTTKVLSGRTLVNAAAATWSAGQINMGGVISNSASGTFDCAFDGTMANSGGGTVANAGLFRKTAGTGATTFSSQVAFNNSGTVEVQSGGFTFATVYTQTAGLTVLNGGSITNTVPLRIQGGVLAGTNFIAGSVTNSGALNPGTSPGKLTITGAYTQTNSGTLNIEIAGTSPGTTFDLLAVGGAATLAGTLNVALTNGFYPATNAVFTFLTNGSRSGTFATFNFPSNDVGMQVNYTTTNASIQVINVRPVLPVFSNQTNAELTLFTLNAAATDDDVPAQTLTYSLTNSPTGASIDSNGQITWTPTEAQGPMTTNITVVVKDNGTPNLTVSRTFQIVVTEINTAPTLTLPSNPSVSELTLFSGSASATDPDIPTNSLTFELVSGPTGLTVSSAGAISWTPTESQGSNAYTITVRVTDNNPVAVNAQQLSTTNNFVLTVNEVNLPPVLTVPTNQIILEETALNVSASATDPDLPANPLTFSLLSPPTGMTINPANGAISWTPTEAQGSNLYTITVVVADTNSTAVNAKQLSTTNTFTVTVNESNRPPVLTVPPDQTVHATTPLSLTATATDPDIPTNTLTFGLVSGPSGLAVNPAGSITWTPADALAGTTNPVQVRVVDNGIPSLGATQSFNIIVVSRPRLAPPVITSSNATLSWSAIAGKNYRLQFKSSLNPTNWTDLVGDVTAPGTNATKVDTVGTGTTNRFYRVRVVP